MEMGCVPDVEQMRSWIKLSQRKEKKKALKQQSSKIMTTSLSHMQWNVSYILSIKRVHKVRLHLLEVIIKFS